MKPLRKPNRGLSVGFPEGFAHVFCGVGLGYPRLGLFIRGGGGGFVTEEIYLTVRFYLHAFGELICDSSEIL